MGTEGIDAIENWWGNNTGPSNGPRAPATR
jgi:hypothetical protein